MKRRILLFSVLLNLCLFLLSFAFHAPIWATNDDYRMAVILSGAYLGEPSADAIFLEYPLGLLLSAPYGLFPWLPVYGIYTELSLFVSCCVIAYAILERMAHRPLRGALLYLLLYALALRKYTILPQFTLTSTYLGLAAAVLLYRLPRSAHRTGSALLAAVLSLFSFLTRAKAFYLLIPVIAAILLWQVIAQRRLSRAQLLYLVVTIACVLCSLLISARYWQREEYAAYREFNTARHRVYDYGEIPFFYDDAAFYLSNDIDETLYRQIAARYLDLDARLNADMLNVVADRIEETTTGTAAPVQRLFSAFSGSFASWFSSTDETVLYTAALVLVAMAVCTSLMLTAPADDRAGEGKRLRGLPLVLFAGLALENMYFLFIGRLMTRQLDALLITAAVLGVLMTIDLACEREETHTRLSARNIGLLERTTRFIAYAGLAFVCIGGICGASSTLCDEHAAAINRNAKLESLYDLAAANPENFYFYDTQYFISSTDDVFEIYDASRPLNMESLGSWNVGSPSYRERNRRMGFESAIEGLTKYDHVYFVAVAEPRLAMTRTLKQLYNKKLCEAEQFQAANCTLHVYSVVGDD